MTLYSIKDWQKHFELRDTSRVDGPLKWIPVPTKTDGLGFGRLRQHKRAADLLAAWYLMLGIAAKQPRQDRGKLVRDGLPLTAEDLGLMTGFDVNIFSLALPFFCNPLSGWMVAQKCVPSAVSCGESGSSCGESGLQERRVEESRGEEKKGEEGTAVAAPATDSEWLASLGTNPAYEGINIGAEYGKMTAWCGANRKQPTRKRFVNWLNRADKPMPRQITIGATIAAPDGPQGWRETLARIRPGNTFDGAWNALPATLRQEITAPTRP